MEIQPCLGYIQVGIAEIFPGYIPVFSQLLVLAVSAALYFRGTA